MLKFRELKQIGPTVIRSWLIGNIIGILPGAGASIACFLGYNTAKQFSKKPEDFGRGSIEGVAGSEAANNAVTGGSLIPTLTLGIPGESVTAVLMGGLIIQGLQPGPELFTKYAPMTYTFFAGFVIVQFFMLLIGLGGCRIFAQIVRRRSHSLHLCPLRCRLLCHQQQLRRRSYHVHLRHYGLPDEKTGIKYGSRRPRPYFRTDRRKRPPQKPDPFGQ